MSVVIGRIIEWPQLYFLNATPSSLSTPLTISAESLPIVNGTIVSWFPWQNKTRFLGHLHFRVVTPGKYPEHTTTPPQPLNIKPARRARAPP